MKIGIILLLILQLYVLSACGKKYGKIIFTSNRDGNEEIYIMNDDGTNQTNLTNNPALDWYPNWSPDSKKIVFSSSRDVSDPNGEDIYIMNVDGSDVERLTSSQGWSGFGSWSPDGKRIVFCSNRHGPQNIYTMNNDGSNVIRLTTGLESDYFPNWSSDGTQIIYMRLDNWSEGKTGEPCGPNGGNCEIYIMNSDGTNQVDISNHPLIDGYPSWAPDGKRIAFNRAYYKEEIEVCNLFIMRPDGTELTPLTHQKTIHQPMGGGIPRWSPDGSKIVFQSVNDKGYHDIYLINTDGSERINITNNSVDDWYAVYSPVWFYD